MAVYCLFLVARHLSRAFYIDRVRREREERLNRKVMALMRSFGE
jgi:hypothetical protein